MWIQPGGLYPGRREHRRVQGERLQGMIAVVCAEEFAARPSYMGCRNCDYGDLCEMVEKGECADQPFCRSRCILFRHLRPLRTEGPAFLPAGPINRIDSSPGCVEKTVGFRHVVTALRAVSLALQ